MTTIKDEASSTQTGPYLLTTEDNPYNPFTQFDEWKAFDEQKGYYTMAYLARVSITSEDLSEKDYEISVQIAIDEIIALNLTGNYKKIYKNS